MSIRNLLSNQISSLVSGTFTALPALERLYRIDGSEFAAVRNTRVNQILALQLDQGSCLWDIYRIVCFNAVVRSISFVYRSCSHVDVHQRIVKQPDQPPHRWDLHWIVCIN